MKKYKLSFLYKNIAKHKKGVSLNAETFEPYGFKNVALFVKYRCVKAEALGVRSYMHDMSAMISREIKDPQLMKENIMSFFGGMTALTGTLWESKTTVGSLDHGFASYVAHTILLAHSE